MEKSEPLCTVGGIADWCSHYWKQYRGSYVKLKIELVCDIAIVLMGTYRKKMKNTNMKRLVCLLLDTLQLYPPTAALCTKQIYGSNLMFINR